MANNVVTEVATAISRASNQIRTRRLIAGTPSERGFDMLAETIVSIHSGRWKEDEAIALDGPSWTPWLIPRRPT